MNPDLSSFEEQRKAVRRARRQGRQWILRGVLLAVVAAVSLTRGGSFYISLGIALAVIAVLAMHMGRQMRLSATDMERKIQLMAAATPDPRPPAPGPA